MKAMHTGLDIQLVRFFCISDPTPYVAVVLYDVFDVARTFVDQLYLPSYSLVRLG